MKVMCNNPACRFCYVTDNMYHNHCTRITEISLDWHWNDEDQSLIFCMSYEPKEEDNGQSNDN